MATIHNASEKDIPLLQDLAEKTWWPTYSPILSEQQIRYMLDNIYSPETLLKVMRDGSQEFLLLEDEAGYQGFASFGPRKEDTGVYKLHKLYVLPQNQGKGYGKLFIDEIRKRLAERQIQILDLNVNRYNPAHTFYKRLGFKVIREEDIPVGPYWMNDYVMRIEF